MWHYITCETVPRSMNCKHICIFFSFLQQSSWANKHRMFLQQCRQVPWKSLECNWSPMVELSLRWVKPLLPPLTFSSSSICRCSTVSWSIPMTAVSMAMDSRQAEQWLLPWACDFPCWTQERNPGVPVWAPQCGSYLSRLPQGSARGCRAVLPPQRLLYHHRGPVTSKILPCVFDKAAEGFRSTQDQFICHPPKTLVSLSTTRAPEGLTPQQSIEIVIPIKVIAREQLKEK